MAAPLNRQPSPHPGTASRRNGAGIAGLAVAATAASLFMPATAEAALINYTFQNASLTYCQDNDYGVTAVGCTTGSATSQLSGSFTFDDASFTLTNVSVKVGNAFYTTGTASTYNTEVLYNAASYTANVSGVYDAVKFFSPTTAAGGALSGKNADYAGLILMLDLGTQAQSLSMSGSAPTANGATNATTNKPYWNSFNIGANNGTLSNTDTSYGTKGQTPGTGNFRLGYSITGSLTVPSPSALLGVVPFAGLALSRWARRRKPAETSAPAH